MTFLGGLLWLGVGRIDKLPQRVRADPATKFLLVHFHLKTTRLRFEFFDVRAPVAYTERATERISDHLSHDI